MGILESQDKVQRSIIHRYEKRIRKTQRVANNTELKLKKQMASLLHFKKELSRHITKLNELSSDGNEHARKRLREVKLKIAQIDKVVPYLEKYVSVNRQAELQTISVLKESCTMELRQHGNVPSPVGFKADSRIVRKTSTVTTSEVNVTPTEGTPNSISTHMDHPPIENPYATLSDAKKEAVEACTKVQSNYAELNFYACKKPAAIRPPSVNYVEVQIVSGDKSIMKSHESTQNASTQSNLNLCLERNKTDTDSPSQIIEEVQRSGGAESCPVSSLSTANFDESHVTSCKDPLLLDNVTGHSTMDSIAEKVSQ